MLLGYQPLTNGICDNVLDVVEGIVSETVIELMREEKGTREIYDSEKNVYVRKNQKDVTHLVIRCAKKHCR